MTKPLNKLRLKTNTLFKFEQKKPHGGQLPSDTTLTITITGETFLTVLRNR